jgi:archaellum component FlaC
MKKNKEECISIVEDIKELVNEIKEIIETGKDLKQNEALMKNIRKFERYD